MNCGVSRMYMGRRWPHPRSSQVFSRVPVVGLSFPLDNNQEEIPMPWPMAVTAGLFWDLHLPGFLPSDTFPELTTSRLRQGHPQW